MFSLKNLARKGLSTLCESAHTYTDDLSNNTKKYLYAVYWEFGLQGICHEKHISFWILPSTDVRCRKASAGDKNNWFSNVMSFFRD